MLITVSRQLSNQSLRAQAVEMSLAQMLVIFTEDKPRPVNNLSYRFWSVILQEHIKSAVVQMFFSQTNGFVMCAIHRDTFKAWSPIHPV